MYKKYLVFLLTIGFLFRIIANFYNYSGDIPTLILWGKDSIVNGLSGFYDRNFEHNYGFISPNYPPVAIYVFSFLYLLKGWIYEFTWFLNLQVSLLPSKIIFFLENSDYLPYLFKLPSILADIGIAYLTYLTINKLIKKNNHKWAIISAAFVIFNPAFFYNSTIWGQTDSQPLFFVFIAFYILIFKKQILLSSLLFSIALLTKQTIIIFLPIFLIYLLIKKGISGILQSLITIFVTCVILFLPFIRNQNIFTYPFETYYSKILNSPGIPYTSNHAFNFWYLINGSRTVKASAEFIWGLSYEVIGVVIVALIFSVLIIKLLKNFSINRLYFANFLIAFTSFLFLTKMHERHLILVLPFLLLLTYKNKFMLTTYIYVSLFNFLNMYHDWWSPNIGFLMILLSSQQVIFILTLILFGFYTYSLKNYFFMQEKKVKQI